MHCLSFKINKKQIYSCRNTSLTYVNKFIALQKY